MDLLLNEDEAKFYWIRTLVNTLCVLRFCYMCVLISMNNWKLGEIWNYLMKFQLILHFCTWLSGLVTVLYDLWSVESDSDCAWKIQGTHQPHISWDVFIWDGGFTYLVCLLVSCNLWSLAGDLENCFVKFLCDTESVCGCSSMTWYYNAWNFCYKSWVCILLSCKLFM